MISKEAFVSHVCELGREVEIGPFSFIGEDVKIGDHTWIGPHVTIMNGARIGKNCKIYPGAVISADPQDLKYSGEDTTVHIGDEVIIRECVTVNKGTALDRGETFIGNGCVLMAYTHLAHDCVVKENVIIANSVQIAGHVQIDEFAFLGGAAAVHQFVQIGAHTMISGGSMVRKDVPPYITAARDPLAYVGVNSVGLRRRGFSNQKIREIQDVYRIFYLSGLNHSDALLKIKLELPPSPERDEVLRFIEQSDRGIIRGARD